MLRRISATLLLLSLSASGLAAVLPEDRADVLYHLYDGGGVTIDGPSVLVRKQVAKNLSLVGNHYLDYVSSASIDVVTTASPYDERREQWSLGMDYLRGNTTMSLNYVSSVESDYDASTWALSVKQDFFGQLTTVALSYGHGENVVGRSDDETFSRDMLAQQYGVSITQILTKNLITALNFETVTEEGYLNNPYRTVRYRDAEGYSYEQEVYPNTRTSNALGIRAKYFLPYRAAIEAEYRYFTDTWDIEGHTFSLGYTHPWKNWIFTGKVRFHDQTGASFFSDLFPRSEATNFRGRDKELSDMNTTTVQLKASYTFLDDPVGWQGFLKRGAVSASLDYLTADYNEFRDLTSGAPVGEEPFYSLEANVVQIFVSFWY